MQIAVCCKVVADDQDIVVGADGALDFTKAHLTISTYDQNAIEAAAQLAEANEAKLIALTAGGAAIDDSKVKKSILSRGVDELYLDADDAFQDVDAFGTARILAQLCEKAGNADVIVCGDGSADNYAQQVDVQLAEAMGLPCATAVVEMTVEGDQVVAKRLLEKEIEVVSLPMPCLISVSPDAAEPRICGMKEILAAGKKPATAVQSADLSGVPAPVVEVVEVRAPEPQPRRLEIFDASVDGDVDKFVAALKEALR